MDMPDDKKKIDDHFDRLYREHMAVKAEQEAQQAEQKAEQKAEGDAQQLQSIQQNLTALLLKRKSDRDRAAQTPKHVPDVPDTETKLEYMRACLCRI